MSTSQICILLETIVVYLVAMVLVGVYCSRKGGGDSSNEFYLGGRKLGPIVTAMSAEASDMSSYLLMGLPGLAYLSGVAEVGWTALGLAIGRRLYLNWLIVAKRLRRYTAKVGAITIPSFFSRRYQDQRNVLSCIAAVVILIFFIPYTASGFKAIGTLFNSLFGVDYHTTMIIGAAVVIGYTVLGGFLAVSTTDPDPEHHHDLCSDLHRALRHPAGWRVGSGGLQRLLPAWLPERDRGTTPPPGRPVPTED